MENSGLGRIACIATLFCMAIGAAAGAQTYANVASFTGSNGSFPYGTLVQGLNGNLYGVAMNGGVSTVCPESNGCGTVFEVTPAGKVTVLYNFCQLANCADGALPLPGLVLATNGNFYGMTSAGGKSGGTIFEITSGGKFTSLYSFCANSNTCNNADGHMPQGTLVQAADGNLYGVTREGGDYNRCTHGCGVIFQITQAGAYSVFHAFCSTTECTHDGRTPGAGLIQATNGNLAGTTASGGLGEVGIVYEISLAGKLVKLHDFCSPACSSGWNTTAPPIEGADGNLYGTTVGGGTSGEGVFYQLTFAKAFTDLYDFASYGPPSGLALGTDGNFYGTAANGGTSTECSGFSCGVLFQLTPAGESSILYSFCSQASCTDGGSPSGAVTQATNGMFYGTSQFGGTGSGCGEIYGCGAIYSYSAGLSPFVAANPNFGAAGKVVNILGNNLTGTTSVTFNGVSAAFQVVSSTYIKAQVPGGATTGTIVVTTPGGTLNSNVTFQVLP